MTSDTNNGLGRHACAFGWAIIFSFGFSVVFAFVHHGLLPVLTDSLQAVGIGAGPLGRLSTVLAVASPVVPPLAAAAGLALAYLGGLPGPGRAGVNGRNPTVARVTGTVGWLVLAFYASVFAASLLIFGGFIGLIFILYHFGVSLQGRDLGFLPVATVVGLFGIPCVITALTLIQGIRGRLPGTRKDTEDNEAMQVDAPASRH